MHERKTALAVVAGPWRLMQVIWLTYVYSDFDWDIDLIRYGENVAVVDEMEEQCVKSGRFRNVYNSKYSAPSSFSPFSVLCKEYFKMIVYFLAGKKKKYCKKLIERNVDKFEYDMLVVACSYSLLEGAILNFSDEIETHVIEEGMGDYSISNYQKPWYKQVVGNILCRMKYTNINCCHDFSLYTNCIKWATSPDKLIFKQWKGTKKLFDPDLTDVSIFYEKLFDIYNIDKDNYDLIIFTSPLDVWGKNDGFPELHSWVSENYPGKKILIKKHPCDQEKYEWKDLDIDIKYTSVPGEVILKCFSNTSEFVFVYLSSIFMSVDRDSVKYKVCKLTKNVDDRYNQTINAAIEQWKILDQNILYL